MDSTCPQCFSQLANSEVGNLCISCGYLQRRHHNHTPAQDNNHQDNKNHKYESSDHIIPGNLEAPRGLDDLIFDNPENTYSTEDPNYFSPDSPILQVNEPPKIINHHTSSQYRRRLNQQRDILKTPEIESHIEPESSLEQPDPQESLALADAELSLAVTPEPEAAPEDHYIPEESDTIEVSKPHRPSPYMLNMGELQTSEANNVSSHHAAPYIPPPPPHTPITNHNATERQGNHSSQSALDRADSLLAAASIQNNSPKPTTNYLMIVMTIILILGVGTFLALNLMQKPSPKPLTSSPVSQPQGHSPSANPTPSNLTESVKRDGERKDSLNTIAIALAAYKKSNGNYPVGNDIGSLTALTTSTPPYLSEIKYDPLSNAEASMLIKYGYNSDGSKFTLTASLENKQDPDAVNGLYVVKSP